MPLDDNTFKSWQLYQCERNYNITAFPVLVFIKLQGARQMCKFASAFPGCHGDALYRRTDRGI